MIESAKILREKAWADLSNKWNNASALALVLWITYMFSYNLFIFQILLFPIYCSYSICFLLNHRGAQQALKTDMLGKGYKQFARITTTMFLSFLYASLWSLALTGVFFCIGLLFDFKGTPMDEEYLYSWWIPFFLTYTYKQIQYGVTPYILHDYPYLSNNRAIELSMKMMKGHIMKYIKLYLSFWPWWILIICSLGIALLWLSPYAKATEAIFYEQIKEDYESKYAS